DDRGYAMGADGGGQERDPWRGQAGPGVIGRDDEVARERHLETAAEGVAVHRGDDRLPARRPVRETPEAGLGEADHVPPVLGRIAQIVAGRERLVARAGEDADPYLRVALELVPDLVQLEVGRRMQRVHPLRTIDRDDADASLRLVRGELVGHLAPHSDAGSTNPRM